MKKISHEVKVGAVALVGMLADVALARAYRTTVDPRLNYEQALELAMLIAGQRRA